MTLQEEMFAMVSEWKSSGLTKKSFLADKPIGLAKFNYWCEKFSRHMTSLELPSLRESSPFRELLIDDGSIDAATKVLELTTRSGLRITVFG
jgi:hypothetical protein